MGIENDTITRFLTCGSGVPTPYIRFNYNHVVSRFKGDITCGVQLQHSLAADATFPDHATPKVIKPPNTFS
jgi:hypothetical protein